LNPPPTKLKSINSELQSDSGGGVEHWNCPSEQGWDKELNSQWTKAGEVTD
jgi:hypothetical protein